MDGEAVEEDVLLLAGDAHTGGAFEVRLASTSRCRHSAEHSARDVLCV